MRTFPSLAASALLALIAGSAQATVLASAPIEGYPSDQTLSCNIVNLNIMQRTVTIELVDYLGDVLFGDTFGLPPNHGQALASTSGSAAGCRFTVDGSARSYRAVAVYDKGGKYTTAIPAQ
jgi:hypothetical protein